MGTLARLDLWPSLLLRHHFHHNVMPFGKVVFDYLQTTRGLKCNHRRVEHGKYRFLQWLVVFKGRNNKPLGSRQLDADRPSVSLMLFEICQPRGNLTRLLLIAF